MEERKEEKAEIKNLGNITLSEKAGPKTTHYMECPEQANLQREKIDQCLLGGGQAGIRVGEVITEGYRVSFGGDENDLKLVVVMLAQLCEYTKNQ